MDFKSRLLALCLVWPVVSSFAQTQDVVFRPSPLTDAPGAPAAGSEIVTLNAARRAAEMGFPAVAAGLYRDLIGKSGVDQSRVTLALATALLSEGDLEGADKVLQSYAGVRGSAWRLRSALLAAQGKRVDPAKAELALIKFDELPPEDRGWYFFLQGMLADAANDFTKANEFFDQAAGAAAGDLQRVRFILAREQARLAMAPANEAQLEALRKNVERYQGQKVGYGFIRQYAIALRSVERRSDAVSLLQRHLPAIPVEERAEGDDFRLLLGLIAGAEQGAGRNALEQLIAGGVDRDKQRIALQLLARASLTGVARSQFRKKLDEWIGGQTPHPLLADLLLFRAQVALADKNYQQAEDDARALLQRFPGSTLKSYAHGVLTGSAWEQKSYRRAADNAVKAQADLQAGPMKAELAVLVAEALFRAGDFINAADAYAAALQSPPPGADLGALMFQRVLSEIEASRIDIAEAQLDLLARNPAFDVINRWQAEWNLARALQIAGKADTAYARINRLVAPQNSAVVPADLQARMSWLQARLSFEVGQSARTLELVDALNAGLNAVTPTLRTDIQSTNALLKARALFRQGKETEAIAVLQKLRADFPRSDAAVYSYIVEANHNSEQDKIVEAQQLLTKLADEFPESDYAPYALYQAALQAERRGQDANFIEANKLIESLVKRYPGSKLVFFARLKQGDLLRRLGQYPQAQQAYESLVNNFAQDANVVFAQLALAECHNAQAANSPTHTETAMTLFEHLRDRVDAPPDVRVEAGFNLGYLLMRRGETAKARDVWWRDVVNEFLLDDKKANGLRSTGRYWMSRTLLELGLLLEQEGKLDQARQAWELILSTPLPGETLAKAKLARFNLPVAMP